MVISFIKFKMIIFNLLASINNNAVWIQYQPVSQFNIL
jgi:hypothetical protein